MAKEKARIKGMVAFDNRVTYPLNWAFYGPSRSTVHLVAAANPHYQNTQSIVLDEGDDAVIAYPVLPKLAQLGTLERVICGRGRNPTLSA